MSLCVLTLNFYKRVVRVGLFVTAAWTKTMTAAEKPRPTLEVLQQSWAWRNLAYKQANWELAFQWNQAWDILLDDLLTERPDLRVNLD